MFGKAFLVIFLLNVLAFVNCDSNSGKSIGSLYQCAHGLRGEVFVQNERQIMIRGFNYDGKGPAAWFHAQKKGSKKVYTTDGNFTTLPYPDATCDRLTPGKSYKDEDVKLILPASIKEYATIGVFCYQFCHNFGHIIIPDNLDVAPAPADLLQVQECPKPNYNSCKESRNGNIKPDCPAGASQIIPSGFMFGCAVLAILLAMRK